MHFFERQWFRNQMPIRETNINEKDSAEGTPKVGVTGRKIIYNPDGTPCRACNTLLDFQFATGKGKSKPHGEHKKQIVQEKSSIYDKECPPDVEKLGRSSWTLLHSIAAQYPEKPSSKEQADLKQFLKLFGNFYPCSYCGDGLNSYMEKKAPETQSGSSFGKWLCDAHNEVNVRLGKPKFDCNLWKQRWKDGWDDGSCD